MTRVFEILQALAFLACMGSALARQTLAREHEYNQLCKVRAGWVAERVRLARRVRELEWSRAA